MIRGFVLALVAVVALSAGVEAGQKVRKIKVDEVVKLLDRGEPVLFLDVRDGGASDRIPNAVHVPVDRLDGWAATIDRDTRIVAYCACPSELTSADAVRRLQKLGFTNVFALRGGLDAWNESRRK